MFSRGDESFSTERKKELINKSITKLYIPAKGIRSFVRYQENNLQSILEDEKRDPEEKSQVVYHVARNLAQDLLSDPRSGINIDRATNWVDKAVGYILNDENAFSSLLKVTMHDYYTYTHSVNMSVLGLLFGRHLSLDTHSLNCLGTGMLLHDLGKVEIPLKILNKPGKLSIEEFEILKKHPEWGLAFLEGKENIDEMSLKVVIQHHENVDGTGYPNKITGMDIHLFGRISRIIDVYDAMTTDRPYRRAIKPFAALAEMKQNMSECFQEELFKEFICFLGPIDKRKERRGHDMLDDTNGVVDRCRAENLSCLESYTIRN